MSGKIYLIQDDDTLLEMSERPYGTEDILQKLLAQYPDLLAGEQVNPDEPRRWLLISREIGVPGEMEGGNRWSLDHLFLDQDGIPTLVEVKRSSDHRIRREVVGQMLDYAANAVVYWSLEEIRAKFEAKCEAQGQIADELILELIASDPQESQNAVAFWELVKTNLQAGKIRLVFVADVIPPELRRIVEFLNEQMEPAEVIAIEIRQYVGQGIKTLVPRVVGQTAEAQRKKNPSAANKRQWDEETFFIDLSQKCTAEVVSSTREILEWSRNSVSRVWWGKGSKTGSFVPVLHHQGTDHQLFAVLSSGNLELYFYWLAYKLPFKSEEKRRELWQRLNEIPGLKLPEDAIFRRPSIQISALVDSDNLKQFLVTFNWVLEQIKAVE